MLNKNIVNNIPNLIGVYLFKCKNKILYVGKSINIKARISSHLENAKIDAKENAIFKKSDHVEYILCESEFKALLLESKLIQEYHPIYNIRWRDDKSYLYIKITFKDDYPKIYSTRKEKQKGSIYFGPFSSTREVENILSEIRRVIPYCSQKKLSKHTCFYNKIKLCSPCPNVISSLADRKEMIKQKREYRSNIRKIIRILIGETEIVLKSLYRNLSDLIKSQKYEEALVIRNRIHRFEHFLQEKTFDPQEIDYNQSTKAIECLSSLVVKFFPKLKTIHRIECYDISNLSFKDATASMTVVTDGLIDKAQYRKFKIRNKRPRSDFEMLKEVLKRRFNNDWPTPDLIVVDGGRPQVHTMYLLLYKLKKSIPFIGIAKHPDRLVIGLNEPITLRPAQNDLGFNLVRRIRDESHRFARKYHLMLRSQAQLK